MEFIQSVIMLPNMRFPRLNIKLNITTVNKKNTKLKNANIKRQRQRNFFSCCILMRNCSARGTSKVKSVSGRVDGYNREQKEENIFLVMFIRAKSRVIHLIQIFVKKKTH